MRGALSGEAETGSAPENAAGRRGRDGNQSNGIGLGFATPRRVRVGAVPYRGAGGASSLAKAASICSSSSRRTTGPEVQTSSAVTRRPG